MSSSHDRVLAALELRQPDRVPVFDLMNDYGPVYEMLGRRPSPTGKLFGNPYTARALDTLFPLLARVPALGAVFSDPEVAKFAHDGAEAAVGMGYDAAWISYFPILRFMGSKKVIDLYGRSYDMILDKKGNVGNPTYREGLFTGPDDWNAWDKKPLMGLPAKVNRVYKKIQKDFGDKLFIFGFSQYGLYENTWQPLGFPRYTVAIRREKEFMRRYIKFFEDLQCMMMEAMADAGLPGIVYTDDLAYKSGPMVSPKVIEDLYGDSYRRIADTAHKLGMKIIFHSCGNTMQFLKLFADCGFDAVHPLEPTADMRLAEVKEAVGERLCLVGNIDVSHILVDATKEEVFEAVRQAIRDAGPGGGYILAPDHGHPDISVQRLRWMKEAADKYGAYPLALWEEK